MSSPMRNIAGRLLWAFSVFLVAANVGCVVTSGAPRRTHAARPACHPSQYWDGMQCRHKGRGRGARKHDGRFD